MDENIYICVNDTFIFTFLLSFVVSMSCYEFGRSLLSLSVSLYDLHKVYILDLYCTGKIFFPFLLSQEKTFISLIWFKLLFFFS